MKTKTAGTVVHSRMALARSFKGKEPSMPMGATGRKTVAEHQRERLTRQKSGSAGSYAC